eukprot:7848308-Lingulodinium_polyedra.AAC.1
MAAASFPRQAVAFKDLVVQNFNMLASSVFVPIAQIRIGLFSPVWWDSTPLCVAMFRILQGSF